MRRSSIAGAGALAAAALVLTMVATPSAQRRAAGGGNQGLPVATNSIVANPDEYYGKTVTVSAGIERVLSKTAFVIDQRRAVSATGVQSVGTPLLVIAPDLSAVLDTRHYLLMRGQLVKFEPAALAKVAPQYRPDLTPEAMTTYAGRPVLLAASVKDSTYTELAKKPVTAEDVTLTTAMKTIAPSFAALRTAMQDSKADVVAQQSAALASAFGDTETVWAGLKQDGAATLARNASTLVAGIQAAAAAADWDKVKASTAALNVTCQNCHNTYRERQDDDTYRIKRVAPMP